MAAAREWGHTVGLPVTGRKGIRTAPLCSTSESSFVFKYLIFPQIKFSAYTFLGNCELSIKHTIVFSSGYGCAHSMKIIWRLRMYCSLYTIT